MIGTAIGQWKLETRIKEGVFIAPKVFGYIDLVAFLLSSQGNEVIKVKGYKNFI